MKTLSILLFFSFLTVQLVAQKVMYFDKHGQRVVKSQAHTYKIIEKTESNSWKVNEFSMKGDLKAIYYSNKKDGSVIHGVSVNYFKPKGKGDVQNDTVKLIKSRFHFINGEKNGLSEVFFRSGDIRMRSLYKDDRVVGEQKIFYKTGALQTVNKYSETSKESQIDYYEDGQVKNEFTYSKKAGKKIMIAKTYYETSELYRLDRYVNNTLTEGYCLNKEGDRIEHVPYMIFPKFPGGSKALREYISVNIKYPKPAKDLKVQGRCFVKFIVNTDGSVIKPTVVKSSGNYHLDKEALRVVSTMPEWEPGMQEGEKKKISFTVPINFALN